MLSREKRRRSILGLRVEALEGRALLTSKLIDGVLFVDNLPTMLDPTLSSALPNTIDWSHLIHSSGPGHIVGRPMPGGGITASDPGVVVVGPASAPEPPTHLLVLPSPPDGSVPSNFAILPGIAGHHVSAVGGSTALPPSTGAEPAGSATATTSLASNDTVSTLPNLGFGYPAGLVSFGPSASVDLPTSQSTTSGAPVASTPSRPAAGSTSAQTFVDSLYSDVLHRAPDASGEAFWIDVLDAGTSEGAVRRSFLAAGETRD